MHYGFGIARQVSKGQASTCQTFVGGHGPTEGRFTRGERKGNEGGGIVLTESRSGDQCSSGKRKNDLK